MHKILLLGITLIVLTWSGLQIWSGQTLQATHERLIDADRATVENIAGALDKLPVYKLTFLGARMLDAGDLELAEAALSKATEKDRFYRDAFKYYGYVLQALGQKEEAELALRRAKTLDPREGE